MNVLVIGGAGRVASVVLPYLREHHVLRIYDLKAPGDTSLDHIVGDVGNVDALSAAAHGMDALLYMAMGALDWDTPVGRHTAFDANVKGVYLTLHAAHSAGVMHGVYCSSMSVYDGNLAARYFYDEALMPDARDLYGFTKYLGEQVCHNACSLRSGASANALRLCFPTADDQWHALDRMGVNILATAASDVARAVHAALNYRNGFQTFMISGDHAQTVTNLSKAKRVLGWEPLARQ